MNDGRESEQKAKAFGPLRILNGAEFTQPAEVNR